MTSTALDFTLSTAWKRARLALVVNLVCQVAIVLTGGLVRLTGSGLGCPTWPQCVPGSFTPVVQQAQGYHKYIEFGNRLLTFVLAVAAIAVLVLVAQVDRSQARAAALPLLLVIAQAVLGGVTVLMKLSPVTVAAHMLLSLVTIAVSTWLWLRIRPDRRAREVDAARWPQDLPASVRPLVLALAADSALVTVLGTVVTGSGPHSGDADEPARFGLDPRLTSMVHSGSVWLFVILSVVLLVTLAKAGAKTATGAPRLLYRRTHIVVGIAAVTGVVGYLQYATGLPWGLVAVHMLLAALFIVAVTMLVEALPRRAAA